MSLGGKHTAADTDLVRRRSLVPSQDPHTTPGLFEVNDALLNVILEQVFYTSDSEHGQATLNIRHFKLFNLLLVHNWHFFVSVDQGTKTLLREIIQVIEGHLVTVVHVDTDRLHARIGTLNESILLPVHVDNHTHELAIAAEFKSF